MPCKVTPASGGDFQAALLANEGGTREIRPCRRGQSSMWGSRIGSNQIALGDTGPLSSANSAPRGGFFVGGADAVQG